MNLKQTILRKGIAPLLTGLGVHRLFRSGAVNDAILMFHGVTDKPGRTVRHMQTNEFVKLLQLLTAEFTIAPLDSVISGRDKMGKPRIALTFDDGYLNNFTEACPVLSQMNLPATFFLITDSLNNKNFTLPIDTIDCIIEKFLPASIKLDNTIFQNHNGIYLSGQENIFDYIIRNSERMHDFNQQLKQQFPFDFMNDPYYSVRVRYVDRETLESVSKDPLFSFGSHTQTHVNCINYEHDALLKQLTESKLLIEQITGKDCNGIAYPYGLYDERSRKLTRTAGYTSAYSVSYSLSQDRTDPDIFQRIGISNTTSPAVNLIHLSRLFKLRGVELPVVEISSGKPQ